VDWKGDGIMEHDLTKLPKWAQLLIETKDVEKNLLKMENEGLNKAHEILMNREWFTISGPAFKDGEEFRYLWYLSHEHPHAVCSLGRGDVLVIGRDKERVSVFKH
jgi:hypothetical protein